MKNSKTKIILLALLVAGVVLLLFTMLVIITSILTAHAELLPFAAIIAVTALSLFIIREFVNIKAEAKQVADHINATRTPESHQRAMSKAKYLGH